MACSPTLSVVLRSLIFFSLIFSLGACQRIQEWYNKGDSAATAQTAPPIIFGATKTLSTLPWFLAQEEGMFDNYSEEYQVSLTFRTDDYQKLINQLISGEIQAMVISNIDAIVYLVAKNIETDVILIANYSDGNHALVVTPEIKNIVGKSIAVKTNSAGQYLLERYLLKNQISAEDVPLTELLENEIYDSFGQEGKEGAVVTNPELDRLRRDKQAKVLFDSHNIPKELMDLVIFRRDALQPSLKPARALLAIWFQIMERLQGTKRAATLDAMAVLAETDSKILSEQLKGLSVTDSEAKAMSRLRDRRIKKAMRHIRYFIERHDLGGEAEGEWVSYPGRDPDVLHFNAKPLEEFIAVQ